MTNFLIRVASALVAIGLLSLVYIFGKISGLKILSLVVCCIGVWEYSRMVFNTPSMKNIKYLFIIVGCLTLTAFTFGVKTPFHFFSTMLVLLFSLALWLTRRKQEINDIFTACFGAALGMVYCVGFPSAVISLFLHQDALPWFFLILLITFAGDTFAYLGGMVFGKNKLMPNLSPKKTIEGSIFGMLGSVVAAVLYTQYAIPYLQISIILPWAILASFFCQSGDLFESLIKRVAGVKDSGQIMPGHGGVLDRLDGVYFGAPITIILYHYTNIL